MTFYWSPAARVALLLTLLVAGLWLEQRYPLRKPTQRKSRRVLINLSLAAIGAFALRVSFYPIVLAVSVLAVQHQWGLAFQLQMPVVLGVFVSFLLLDYTLYVWHWMNHRFAFLWRFHNVHHVDLDLDASTALRFHFGELILSTGFRAGQVLFFGIDPFTLILFETLVTTSAQFHHSNIRLPFAIEKHLVKLIVTPRMHGIHHSIVQQETNSNYSTIFSWWDRLHRSLNLGVPQSQITIGVPAYRQANDVTFSSSLLMPFRRHQKPWVLPSGAVPQARSENHGERAILES